MWESDFESVSSGFENRARQLRSHLSSPACGAAELKAAGITATASFPQFKLNGWFNLELGRLHYMTGRGEAEEVCLCMGEGGVLGVEHEQDPGKGVGK